jgi:predicted ATP-binding protein involved in virulence
MYISRIELHNIRCFVDLVIDLQKESDIILWTTILGNNAVGKSTILKCIAMGLCDETSAGALMKESNGEFLRKSETSGYIKLALKNNEDKIVEITTNLQRTENDGPVKVVQEISNGESPWKNLFFCGYGSSIPGGGGEGFDNYKPLEAVYTLFNYASELQNPEVIMLRQESQFRDWLGKKLLNVLMLDGYKIKYTKKGMLITGPWGEFRIDELSDGYRTISQKIIEFFGWAIYAEKIEKQDDEIFGILLLDELETHLHPRWQRNIVDRLRKQLPNVQIIITSHSPIIALGTADLKNALMVELEFDQLNEKVARDREVDAEVYKGLTVDQILTSSPFNLPIARSGVTGDKMLEFRNLFMLDTRTPEETQRFLELKEQISHDIPDAGETEMDRKVQRELKEVLSELNNKIGSFKNDKN